MLTRFCQKRADLPNDAGSVVVANKQDSPVQRGFDVNAIHGYEPAFALRKNGSFNPILAHVRLEPD
jgi:hypothetical protein